jgi:hypothetical protein
MLRGFGFWNYLDVIIDIFDFIITSKREKDFPLKRIAFLVIQIPQESHMEVPYGQPQMSLSSISSVLQLEIVHPRPPASS